ncbi:MAG: 3-methyladenine glycosylase [Anaerocolumna sp.]|jgi:DNA-3-methyladenine glycosylase|nr:3-methyladenine glycosylase [Anaerocolumna sp.]
MKLTRKFYLEDGVTLAKNLIGKVLVHESADGISKGIIVETEAYMGAIDDAAHSYKGKSGRTSVQYGSGGFAYIYLIYGMHYCMNIVANVEDRPEAVLIRALEPIEGIDIMKIRRKTDKIHNLCNGPGKLCQAMGIDKRHYGIDLCGETMYVEDSKENIQTEVIASKRINIDYAEQSKDNLWRFTPEGNKFISSKIIM